MKIHKRLQVYTIGEVECHLRGEAHCCGNPCKDSVLIEADFALPPETDVYLRPNRVRIRYSGQRVISAEVQEPLPPGYFVLVHELEAAVEDPNMGTM